jgi:hypothetical protein
MGTTKIQYIDLTRHVLAGGDTPSELRGTFHPRIVEKLISMAFDSLLSTGTGRQREIMDEMGANAWAYDALTKPFFVEIKKDTERNRYYSDLPVTPMSLNNNQGIRMVCPKQEEETQFMPRRTSDTFLMNGLDVGQLSGLIYYTVEGINKVYYSGNINSCWKEVMMKIAVGFDDLEDTDIVTIPEGKDLQIFDIVRQILMNQPPQDITNDSAAEQTTK